MAGETTASSEPKETAPEPNKNKKKPLIIAGIIAAALLVIGGGVAAFAYFSAKNSPEGIAADIFTNLVKEKNVQATGKIKYGDQSIAIKAVTNSDMNASLNATVTLDEDETVGLDGVFMNDGNLYVKMEDASDYSGSFKGLEDILEDSSVGSTSSGILSALDLDSMSDTWWKISVPEISKAIGNYFSTAITSVIDSVYTCVKDAAKDLYQNNDDQIELYKKHNFLTLKEKSKNVYDASIDRQKLVDYINGLKDTASYKKLSDCFGNLGALSKSINATVDENTDINEQIKDIPTSFVISINDNRQLTKIAFQAGTDYAKLDVDLSFEYKGYTNVTAPSSSESFVDVVDEIMQGFFGARPMGLDVYSSLLSTPNLQDNCSSNIMNCLKTLDIEDI